MVYASLQPADERFFSTIDGQVLPLHHSKIGWILPISTRMDWQNDIDTKTRLFLNSSADSLLDSTRNFVFNRDKVLILNIDIMLGVFDQFDVSIVDRRLYFRPRTPRRDRSNDLRVEKK